jgi:serine/threonine protein kinase, bacterial
MLLGHRYNILMPLAAGGCAETFLAEDSHRPSKQKCVVKKLTPSTIDPAAHSLVRERFEKEAEILEAVGAHDQIPELYAYFKDEGNEYLVEQWIPGPTLTQKVASDGPLDQNFVRDFLVCILPVLGFLHNKSIIHRDIKPDNIILREPDGMPVLIDFGTVKDRERTVLQTGPAASILVSSWGYTSPEQAAGFPVDSSDLFSLGMTAIFLLTGQNPASLPRTKKNVLGWCEGTQFKPYEINQNLLETIQKSIEPLAQNRFQTVIEMESSIYNGLSRRRQMFGPKASTPYMCKVFARNEPMFEHWVEESMKMHPPDSGEYLRGLLWKVPQ